MTAVTAIPLNQLKPSKRNVRRTGGKDIDQLAASIAAMGLLQNLTAVEVGKGYEVVAGGRRLRALQSLAKAGTIPGDYPVSCLVVADESAVEVSLAENAVREQMHPADQFDAFYALAEAGKPIPDIAASFGVSELVVKQRLKLSRVSPALLKTYRSGGITLEQLQALAATEDHAAQERVWKSAKSNDYYARPEQLRRAVCETEVGPGDARVQMVGLAAYEAAGGTLRRDLFSDAAFVQDVALLDRLVQEKLDIAAERLRAEGWSWVETRMERPNWGDFDEVDSEQRDLTAEEQKRYEELEALEDPDFDQQWELEALEQAVDWEDGAHEKCGAIVYLGRTGFGVMRGLLRAGDESPETEADDNQEGDTAAGAAANEKAEKAPPEIPARVVYELTRMRSGELSLRIAADPLKATVALVAHLAESWRNKFPTGLQITHRNDGADVDEAYQGPDAFLEETLGFKGPVLAWLQVQPWETVEKLLAALVAVSVDIVHRYPHQPAPGPGLCEYFNVDLTRTWRPDAEFLMQLPAAVIREALAEVGKDEPSLGKLKKAELAGRAAELLRDTDWLPAPLRLQ